VNYVKSTHSSRIEAFLKDLFASLEDFAKESKSAEVGALHLIGSLVPALRQVLRFTRACLRKLIPAELLEILETGLSRCVD
jgi:hypothetical protein